MKARILQIADTTMHDDQSSYGKLSSEERGRLFSERREGGWMLPWWSSSHNLQRERVLPREGNDDAGRRLGLVANVRVSPGYPAH